MMGRFFYHVRVNSYGYLGLNTQNPSVALPAELLYSDGHPNFYTSCDHHLFSTPYRLHHEKSILNVMHGKLLKGIYLFVLTVAILFFSSGPGMSLQNDTHDEVCRLLQDAVSRDGHVRILVKIDVEDIEKLTAESNRFNLSIQGKARMQSALDADAALAAGIARSTADVLKGLSGTIHTVNRIFSTVPWLALTVGKEALENLLTHPRILTIMEDSPYPLPRPPESDIPRGTHDPVAVKNSMEVVGADVAWELGATGKGWYVAVLDTGIRNTHEMFRGKDIVEQCYALGDSWIYDSPIGDCPNGREEMSGPGSAAPYAERFGHGSHVAGIATGNNGVDRFGVAKDADIIMVQVFSYISSWADVGSWNSDQVKGLEFVYLKRTTYRIASVNMSLGASEWTDFCESDARADIIANLKAVGIPTVISSGNDAYCNGVNSPACAPDAVAVNGSDIYDQEYRWGNWHDVMVDLMAPGVTILSAGGFSDTFYSTRSGTSMAAPHVAGAWAVLRQIKPVASVQEIQDILQRTGTLIQSDRCPQATPKPRIDVGSAVNSLLLDPLSVPILSKWGAVGLFFMLAISGLWIMRRKPRKG